MFDFITELARLPQASEDVRAHFARYEKDSVAERVLLGVSLSVGTVETLDLTMDEFCALCCVKGAVVRQKRSSARKDHDGNKARDHYRLQPAKIAEILRAVVGDRSDRILPWRKGFKWNSKKSILTDQAAFCQRFDCRLTQKPENESDVSKVYTHGDFYEFSVWCWLGENPDNWHKNCRSHKTGTDCAQYEIKSACMYWAGSAVLVGINQYI